MGEQATTGTQTYTFQAEIQQLLKILVHSLYTEREIFLRELISNASDALNRVQFQMLTDENVHDPEAELAIYVEADKDARTLTVRDTGIGMTREELIENLGTIAQSGAAAFLQRLQETGAENAPTTDLIGQFGVGFYSVFMVAEKVVVTSRSYQPDAQAWAWSSDGSTTFTIEPAQKETRGTSVTLYLKEDAAEFLETYRLRAIVKRHSDFIPFPIYIEGEVANQQQAIWRRAPREVSEKDYTAFYRQLTLDFHDPLLHVHTQADAPVQFYSLLYVPTRADRGLLATQPDYGLRLYVRKVLIEERNKDFLPQYLRFVEGVVDSEDLPLNVARESVQATRAIRRIGQALKGKLLSELERLAAEEPERYATFWQQFGIFLKEGVATDPADAERLAKLLRFHSSKSTAQTADVSLADYVARMKEGQEHIYYILADDLQSVQHSPHLDPFRARDLEVLYLTDTVDGFMLMNLTEFEGKKLQNVDDAALELPEVETSTETHEEALDDAAFEAVRQRFADVLGERVLEVRASKMLTDHPVCLAAPEGQLGRHVQRVYRLLEQDFEVPRQILELNRRHPLIRNLAAWVQEQPDAPIVDQVIEQLYESALLLDGLHPNPASMVARIEALMEHATQRQ